ncbi:hypothetical protein [Nocardia sp. CA-120079]|uniref:hypothetical protein n=1 Tax=Nocardia sp. CA-120079 TaxID=3239974 RepID=UPI003D965756
MPCTETARPMPDEYYERRFGATGGSSYKVEFRDADHAVVFDSAGTRLYELERF